MQHEKTCMEYKAVLHTYSSLPEIFLADASAVVRLAVHADVAPEVQQHVPLERRRAEQRRGLEVLGRLHGGDQEVLQYKCGQERE